VNINKTLIIGVITIILLIIISISIAIDIRLAPSGIHGFFPAIKITSDYFQAPPYKNCHKKEINKIIDDNIKKRNIKLISSTDPDYKEKKYILELPGECSNSERKRIMFLSYGLFYNSKSASESIKGESIKYYFDKGYYKNITIEKADEVYVQNLSFRLDEPPNGTKVRIDNLVLTVIVWPCCLKKYNYNGKCDEKQKLIIEEVSNETKEIIDLIVSKCK
jgi:hypothetical protein